MDPDKLIIAHYGYGVLAGYALTYYTLQILQRRRHGRLPWRSTYTYCTTYPHSRLTTQLLLRGNVYMHGVADRAGVALRLCEFNCGPDYERLRLQSPVWPWIRSCILDTHSDPRSGADEVITINIYLDDTLNKNYNVYKYIRFCPKRDTIIAGSQWKTLQHSFNTTLPTCYRRGPDNRFT